MAESNWDARAADLIAKTIDPSVFALRVATIDPEWRPEVQRRREEARDKGRRVVEKLRRMGWYPLDEPLLSGLQEYLREKRARLVAAQAKSGEKE